MEDFNINDILILKSIYSKDENRGMCKARGTSISQISDRCNLSFSKIRVSIKKFIKLGWIDRGIKNINTHTYYITDLGIEAIRNLEKETNV